jgi:hypothetical protein
LLSGRVCATFATLGFLPAAPVEPLKPDFFLVL